MTGSKGSKVFSLIVIVLTIAMVCELAFSNEELVNAGKIIRPAYMSVQPRREYKAMELRGKE